MPMPNLITRLGLHDRLRKDNIKRYALQCSLAAAVVLILLLVLDAVTQTVLIAALGASSFIAFAVPRSLHSSPRCLIGGYVVGIIAGYLMATLNMAFNFSGVANVHLGVIVFGALATGFAMFLMVATKTEHPPAAALALGLVLNEWDGMTLVVVMAGIIVLSICKQLVNLMGGNIGVTQKCQLEFPDSRICSQEEVAATTALPTLITGKAWIHAFHATSGAGNVLFAVAISPSSTSSCSSWQWGGSNAKGSTVDGSTGGYAVSQCDVARPIACCALVP